MNREVKRLKNKLEKYFEPLALVALLLLFALPTLAVINLSPQSSQSTVAKNVLGTEDKDEVGIVLVGGIHDIIKEEFLDLKSETIFEYSTTLIKHEEGTYSKPILQLTNFSSEQKVVNVTAYSPTTNNSSIYLIYDGERFLLQNSSGNTFVQKVALNPSSKESVFLEIVSYESVRFNSEIQLTLGTE